MERLVGKWTENVTEMRMGTANVQHNATDQSNAKYWLGKAEIKWDQ